MTLSVANGNACWPRMVSAWLGLSCRICLFSKGVRAMGSWVGWVSPKHLPDNVQGTSVLCFVPAGHAERGWVA